MKYLWALVLFVGTAAQAAEISPQLSILSPLQFDIAGAGYSASLGEHFLTIPLFSVEAGMAIYRTDRLSIAGLARFGYGMKRANARLVSDTVGVGAKNSDGSLQWMPMLVGARTRFFLSTVPFFRPSITAGFGGSWLRFTPDADASVNTFIPLVFVTPAIHIFEPIEAIGGSVFQGFTFGLSYQRSIFTVQRFQALAFEVSAQWTM